MKYFSTNSDLFSYRSLILAWMIFWNTRFWTYSERYILGKPKMTWFVWHQYRPLQSFDNWTDYVCEYSNTPIYQALLGYWHWHWTSVLRLIQKVHILVKPAWRSSSYTNIACYTFLIIACMLSVNTLNTLVSPDFMLTLSNTTFGMGRRIDTEKFSTVRICVSVTHQLSYQPINYRLLIISFEQRLCVIIG